MLLSDRDIGAALDNAEITIDPLDKNQIQPASIDLRLGAEVRVFENHSIGVINPASQGGLPRTRLVPLTPDIPMVLHPGSFVLGSTLEWFGFGDGIAGRVEGKSSLGRVGLMTHSTAGWIDPGFRGYITLELSSHAALPIMLTPGMLIGQLCLFRLSSPALRPYGTPGLGSRYQDQEGATAARPPREPA